MIARELITNDVPPIRSSETVEKALNWLDEFKVTHLAVVDGVQYQGLVSEDILYDAASSDITIAELNLTLNRPFIYEDRHIYEVMKMVSDMQLSVAPILDKSDNYLGLTTLPSLMHLISNTASISEPGSVIVLELNQNDYSLGHLAQIIEGDDTMETGVSEGFTIVSQLDAKKAYVIPLVLFSIGQECLYRVPLFVFVTWLMSHYILYFIF